MKMHKSLTIERVQEAVEESMFGMENTGFCLACGAERDGCEPDASRYECWDCGKYQVYGAELVFMMIG